MICVLKVILYLNSLGDILIGFITHCEQLDTIAEQIGSAF